MRDTTLGPYRILDLIGKGGMAEVYRAEDPRLGRQVAIKILPSDLAEDGDRLARFQREARLAATLSHPHIAAIHDVGQADADGRRVHYIVQELLRGHSLRTVLDRGPLPLERALPLAAQIAEALAAAHRAGIVHRDLKPDNVFVCDGDHAKVLDFGIAKVLEPAGGAPREATAADDHPTAMHTGIGTVMGTVGYMAPEQITGGEVDHRTDVFAFGCVLFEMLTARHPFAGANPHDTLNRVLTAPAPSLADAIEGVPRELDRIVSKCLSKSPSRRYQGTADLAIDLRELATRTAAGLPEPSGPERDERRGVGAVLMAAVVLGVAVASALIATWLAQTGGQAPAAALRLSMSLPAEHRPNFAINGLDIYPAHALAPDGSFLVYSAASPAGPATIYRRRLDRFDAEPIPGTEGGFAPFLSPDGRWVGFSSLRGVRKVPVDGGSPQVVSDLPAAAGATWGDDGTIVLSNQGKLFRVADDGGEQQPLTFLGDASVYAPHFLPGARKVVVQADSEISTEARLAIVDLDRETITPLSLAGGHPVYAPSGHLLFARGDSLFAVELDAEAGTVRGDVLPVADGARGGTAGVYATVSRNGTLVYPLAGSGPRRELVWVDRQGHATPVGVSGDMRKARISPEGDRIVYSEDGHRLWIYELASGARTPIGEGFSPTWSADGRWIAFSWDVTRFDLYRVPADFSSAAEEIYAAPGLQMAFGWTDDDLIGLSVFRDNAYDLEVLDLGQQGPARPFVATASSERTLALSPNGRWATYVSDTLGSPEVFVQAFPTAGRRWQVSDGGGDEPVWSRDGTELYYRDAGRMMAVPVSTDGEFRHGRPQPLFDDPFFRETGRQYDPAPDGRLLMIRESTGPATGTLLQVMLGWGTEMPGADD